MRRNILLALIAALALAVGLSNVATADQGSADASAKAGKKGKRGKGKACKGNRGKGRSRGKARRSADASAKPRKGRKGKARGKGCGNANWVKTGEYAGANGVEVEIRSRKQVFVRFPEAPATCIVGIVYGVEIDNAKVTANKLTAKYVAPPGTRGFVQRWEFTLTADYRYKLVIDSDSNDIGIPCSKRGATFQGKLKKVG